MTSTKRRYSANGSDFHVLCYIDDQTRKYCANSVQALLFPEQILAVFATPCNNALNATSFRIPTKTFNMFDEVNKWNKESFTLGTRALIIRWGTSLSAISEALAPRVGVVMKKDLEDLSNYIYSFGQHLITLSYDSTYSNTVRE